MRANRPTILLFAAAVGLVVIGCQTPNTPTPTAAGIPPSELVDPNAYGDGRPPPVLRDLYRVGEEVRASKLGTAKSSGKTCLALSGGGAYGAFQAGLLVGWTEAGTRPQFDCVTGVSTGALVAGLAFLGPDYDDELRRVYTTLKTEDIFILKRGLRSLLSESLADTSPLARQIDRVITLEAVSRLAAEHLKGRRLYVGTTDMDGRRPVVWDIGAIAAKNEPGARDLIAKLFLASAAIPAFFPPVEIPVEVDGRRLVERHIDGGTTQNLFFRPPYIPLEYRHRPPADYLAGTDLYVIVAGKLYADPEQVSPKVLKIASASVSTLIYAETRVELLRLYTASMLTGMNYHQASIPQDFPAPKDSAEFNPEAMSRLFEEGRREVLLGKAWRSSPPGVEAHEALAQRAGTQLIRESGPPVER